MADPHIVVIGASLGGLRTVESLRALGVTSPITVVGEEGHMPYNRPPLSKEFLYSKDGQSVSVEDLAFKVRPDLADVKWRLGSRATSANLSGRTVTLADGDQVTFDALVVATGLRPRRLGFSSASAHRFVCRTIDDATAIRARIAAGARAVIAGAGFIGCELASTLTWLGAQVTIVEPFGLPMERSLGKGLASVLLGYHEARGVEFRLGASVTDISTAPDGGIDQVILDNGEHLTADIVIEAMGSLSNVEWLEGNGLDLSDGVLCDRAMRVEGRANIVAVGDVARFPNDFVGPSARRTEHWCVPGQTAKRAAETLAIWLGKTIQREESFAPLPSFWSDQFGIRIQAYGSPLSVERWEVLEGDLSASGLSNGVAVGGFIGGRQIYVVAAALPPARTLAYRNVVVQNQKAA